MGDKVIASKAMTLVLHQGYIDGPSVPVVLCSKAQCAADGYSLSKRCNTAAEHHRDALRVSLSTPMDGVAPLGKGAAITCEMRLAVNVDKLTESANIALVEY